MGNKCQFCRTQYGGSKHVGYRMMGATDCGKCSGVLTSKIECEELGRYYKFCIEKYEKELDYFKETIEHFKQNLEKVREIYREGRFTEE